MSDEYERRQASHEQEGGARRQPAEFQEVPGEAEAEATRDAFLKNAGPSPAGQVTALAGADGATRAHAVSRLQQQRGNGYVQRLVQRAKGTPGRLVGLAQGDMVDEVRQRKGGGQPLPEPAREKLEGHFGADLGGVRVHNDGESHSLNRELNAQAFTVGSDVFFGEGKYDPGSREGQGLIAHEVTHVGQQAGFGGGTVQRAEEEEQKKPEGGEPPKAEAAPAAKAEAKPEEKPAEGGGAEAPKETKKEEEKE